MAETGFHNILYMQRNNNNKTIIITINQYYHQYKLINITINTSTTLYMFSHLQTTETYS